MSESQSTTELNRITALDKYFLTADDVSKFLGKGAQNIRAQAHIDPSKLGFPVVVTGQRVSIPKDGFLKVFGR